MIQKLSIHLSVHGVPIHLQTDNGTQFTSQRFKNFAKRWNFQPVTSSPEYPQSNGLAERTVRSTKQLMERSYLAKSNVYLDLLNLRNISRDRVLGSPAQRLMSRQMRPPLPVPQQQLQPQVRSPTAVQKRVQFKCDMQKRCYDKPSKPLKPLVQGQVIRLQTDKGHTKLEHIHGPSKEPRSYLVEVDGVLYRRNPPSTHPSSEGTSSGACRS